MKATFMFCALIFLRLIFLAKGDYFDLSSLGDIINKQVQEQVQNINKNVHHEIAAINHNVEDQMSKLHLNLHNMERRLSNLGPEIEENVRKSLEPVNAIKIKSQMARGIGGITVATYGDKYTVLYKNGVKYSCAGEIFDDTSNDSVYCTTELSTKFTPAEKICTANSYSRVNNIFCFGENVIIQCLNDSCYCRGGKVYNLQGLKQICGYNFGSDIYAQYIYFPNKNHKNHIPIPNPNKYVTCEDSNDFKCTWYGNGYTDV